MLHMGPCPPLPTAARCALPQPARAPCPPPRSPAGGAPRAQGQPRPAALPGGQRNRVCHRGVAQPGGRAAGQHAAGTRGGRGTGTGPAGAAARGGWGRPPAALKAGPYTSCRRAAFRPRPAPPCLDTPCLPRPPTHHPAIPSPGRGQEDAGQRGGLPARPVPHRLQPVPQALGRRGGGCRVPQGEAGGGGC